MIKFSTRTASAILAVLFIIIAASSVIIFKSTHKLPNTNIALQSTIIDDTSDEDNTLNNDHYNSAVKLYNAKKFSESIKELKLQLNNGQHAQSYYLLGKIYEDNILVGHEGKLLTEMKNSYINYLNIKPNGKRAPYVKLKLAQFYIKSSLNTNSKQDIDTALNLLIGADDTNPDVKMARGAIYLSKKQYEEAVKEFEHAVNLQPNELTTKYNSLGLAYIKLRKFTDAKKALEIAINVEPDNAFAHNNLGYVYIKLGMFVKAKQSFKKAVSLNPDYKNAVNNLNWVTTDKEISAKINKELENTNKISNTN